MGFHPDMGTVPSWIGGASLLLAFRIFRRDRSRSDRAQVDNVGIWGEVQRTADLPGVSRRAKIMAQINVRNATDLPIEVHLVAFKFYTLWKVPRNNSANPSAPTWNEVPGKKTDLYFLDEEGIAPRKSWESGWLPIELDYAAPADDAILHFRSQAVKCIIEYALVVDNAGRRWETRLRQGRPAKRIRWYSRPRKDYPVEWQGPIWRSVRMLKAKAAARFRNILGRRATKELSEAPGT